MRALRPLRTPGSDAIAMPDKLTRDAAERLAEALGEPGWLTERRLAAYDVFEKLDPPDPKGEEWRYTDVRRFDFERFTAPVAAPSTPAVPDGVSSRGVIVT